MFNKLVASGPQRRRASSPAAMMTSVVLHSLLLAGAVYASIQNPLEEEEVEEEVTFMEVEEEPPPPEPEVEQAVAPPPVGFQELIPPVEVPDIIPIVDPTQRAVSMADFSGLGQSGGVATGIREVVQEVQQDPETFAYEVAVLDSPPSITNMAQIQSVMARLYPRMLLDAGISGTVTLQFVVQPDGTVDTNSIKVMQTTNERFSEPSVEALQRFRFNPGKFKGEPVRVLIQMPITWQPAS